MKTFRTNYLTSKSITRGTEVEIGITVKTQENTQEGQASAKESNTLAWRHEISQDSSNSTQE